LLATSLKVDAFLKLILIETNFYFRESNGRNDFETDNKAQNRLQQPSLIMAPGVLGVCNHSYPHLDHIVKF